MIALNNFEDMASMPPAEQSLPGLNSKEYFDSLAPKELAIEALDAFAALAQRDPEVAKQVFAKLKEVMPGTDDTSEGTA